MGMLEDALRAYAKFEDRTDDPATPASGEGLLFFKDGKLHTVDDAGTVVEYGAGGSGGGGGLELIDSWDHSSDGSASFIEFDNIPGSYQDLVLRLRLRTNASATGDMADVRLGGGTVDTGSNYGYAARVRGTGADSQWSSGAASAMKTGWITAGDNMTAGVLGFGELVFRDYATSAARKTMQCDGIFWNATPNFWKTWGQAAWESGGDPIDVVRLIPDNGSSWILGTVELYGRN